MVIVGRNESAAHEAFGALSQCMFVIRPDQFLGLRSQPASMDALKCYLADNISLTDVSAEGWRPPPSYDWFVYVLGAVAPLFMATTVYSMWNDPDRYSPSEWSTTRRVQVGLSVAMFVYLGISLFCAYDWKRASR